MTLQQFRELGQAKLDSQAAKFTHSWLVQYLALVFAAKGENKTLNATKRSVGKRLVGTTWLWENRTPITFGESGDFSLNGFPAKWKVTNSGRVEYSFRNGNHGVIVFDNFLTRGSIHELNPDGSIGDIPLIRANE